MEPITMNIPVLALRGLTAFPNETLSFDVERDISIYALDNAMENDRRLFLVTQKEISVADPTEEDLYRVGTICHILQIIKTSENSVRVIVEGEERARLHRMWQGKPFLQANVEVLEEEFPGKITPRVEAMLRRTYALFGAYKELAPQLSDDFIAAVLDCRDTGRLADLIAQNITLRHQDRQRVLEELRPNRRLQIVNDILTHEVDVLSLEMQMEQKVRQRVAQVQKDMILREQVKVLQHELGDDGDEEITEYTGKIQRAKLPEEVHKRHRADHIAKQAGKRGDTNLLDRLEIYRHGHGKIAQGNSQDDGTRGVGGNLNERRIAAGKEGAHRRGGKPERDGDQRQRHNLVLKRAGERLLKACPSLCTGVEGSDGLQAIGEALGNHHGDVEDVAVDHAKGCDVERAHVAAERAQKRVGNCVKDKGRALDQEEREADLEDLAADGEVELKVGQANLELGLFAPDEPEDTDGPDTDGKPVVHAGAHNAKLEHKRGKREPADGDDGRNGHEVGLNLYFLVHTHHSGDHLANDRERQQHGEGAHAGNGIGHDVGRGAKECADGLGKHGHHHSKQHTHNRGEPKALAKSLACALNVAGTQKVAHHGGHAGAKQVAKGQVDVLDRHDDRDAGQAVGTQAPTHHEALEDHHDDLGEHALAGDDGVLTHQAGNRLGGELALLLHGSGYFFCHCSPLSLRE